MGRPRARLDPPKGSARPRTARGAAAGRCEIELFYEPGSSAVSFRLDADRDLELRADTLVYPMQQVVVRADPTTTGRMGVSRLALDHERLDRRVPIGDRNGPAQRLGTGKPDAVVVISEGCR